MQLSIRTIAASAVLALPLAMTAQAHDKLGQDPEDGVLAHLSGSAVMPAQSGAVTAPGQDDSSKNLHLVASLPQTDATNSDISFWGDLAYVGNYNGVRIFDISAGGTAKLVSTIDCPGPQNDTSVWENILVMSVDAVMDGPECGAPALPNSDPRNPNGWEGIRIFDVGDPANPAFVKSVYTDCGSHTNNIIPDYANDRLLVYVLSYALRNGPTCGEPGEPGSPGNGQISIVEIPFSDLSAASVINEVPIPVDQTFDDLVFAGLGATDGCHDVQFFFELNLAAAACLSVGQMWDISDPANPLILEEIDNDFVEIWHSATFTWDGQVVVFGDETIFGSCSGPDDMHGRLWFHEVADVTDPVGSFLIPRVQSSYCGSHLFNVLPREDGQYLLASSWYGGGTSIIDFNDPTAAVEIGYYDAQVPRAASTWATYWYNGLIYANDISRGFDVIRTSDPVLKDSLTLEYLNPQVQENLID